MQHEQADAVTWLHTSNRARAAHAPSAPVEMQAASAPAKRCIPWALPHRCRQWSPGPTGGFASAQMKQNHKHTGNQLCQVRRHKLGQAAAANGLRSETRLAHLQPRQAAISQLCGTRGGQQAVAGLDILGSSGRRVAATRVHAMQFMRCRRAAAGLQVPRRTCAAGLWYAKQPACTPGTWLHSNQTSASKRPKH